MHPLISYTSFIQTALFASLARQVFAASLFEAPTTIATRECPLNIHPELQPAARFGCSLPVDENVGDNPAGYSPWTHRPTCLGSIADTTKKYCVFTNSRHGHNGVSIVTRPNIAASIVDMLNERPAPPLRHIAETPYEVVDIPGKGKGVVAKRRILKAETIMFDYATMVLAGAFPGSVTRLDGYGLLHTAADQLADPEKFLGLGRSSNQEANVVEDVLRTNAFVFDLGGESHMAVYPEIARVNHACRPNAFVRFMPQTFGASVVTFRDIQPGEEISISYIPFGRLSEDRHKHLARWGFNCTCSLCTASQESIDSSDDRRRNINRMRQEAMEAIRDMDSSRAAELSHEVLRLARTEELYPMFGEQYNTLARIYWIRREKEKAEEYAQMSLDVLELQGYIKKSPEHLAMILRSFDES